MLDVVKHQDTKGIDMKIGIIGSGSVAKTLAQGFADEGHDMLVGTQTAGKLDAFAAETGLAIGSFADAADHGDVVILAVRGEFAHDALVAAGVDRLAGTIVIDATNPISTEPARDGVINYFTEQNSSLMEFLQAQLPETRFVKAFNSVGRRFMIHPDLQDGPPTMFMCGNDPAAKAVVRGLLEQVGWEVGDYGTARAAGAIEALCMLWCIPGMRGQGWDYALKMLAQPDADSAA